MTVKEFVKWVLETNPTLENKHIWEGISNSIWYAYHTEPMAVSNEDFIAVMERAERFEIAIPNDFMQTMLNLHKQIFADNLDIHTILELQRKMN